jgi:MFS transporter, ACS family, allantoate permease
LMACRTILGVFEACVAPILVIIIAMWYNLLTTFGYTPQ